MPPETPTAGTPSLFSRLNPFGGNKAADPAAAAATAGAAAETAKGLTGGEQLPTPEDLAKPPAAPEAAKEGDAADKKERPFSFDANLDIVDRPKANRSYGIMQATEVKVGPGGKAESKYAVGPKVIKTSPGDHVQINKFDFRTKEGVLDPKFIGREADMNVIRIQHSDGSDDEIVFNATTGEMINKKIIAPNGQEATVYQLLHQGKNPLESRIFKFEGITPEVTQANMPSVISVEPEKKPFHIAATDAQENIEFDLSKVSVGNAADIFEEGSKIPEVDSRIRKLTTGGDNVKPKKTIFLYTQGHVAGAFRAAKLEKGFRIVYGDGSHNILVEPGFYTKEDMETILEIKTKNPSFIKSADNDDVTESLSASDFKPMIGARTSYVNEKGEEVVSTYYVEDDGESTIAIAETQGKSTGTAKIDLSEDVVDIKELLEDRDSNKKYEAEQTAKTSPAELLAHLKALRPEVAGENRRLIGEEEPEKNENGEKLELPGAETLEEAQKTLGQTWNNRMNSIPHPKAPTTQELVSV